MKPEDVPAEWMEIGVGAMFDAMAESVGASERWADAPTGAPTPELNRWRLGMRAAIAAVAPLIAAAERDACAQVADYYAKHSTTAKNIVAAIRARGEVK